MIRMRKYLALKCVCKSSSKGDVYTRQRATTIFRATLCQIHYFALKNFKIQIKQLQSVAKQKFR